MPPGLDEIAEDAAAYVRARPGEVSAVFADAVLRHRPWFPTNSFHGHEASRLRLADEPGLRLGEIRAWFRSQGCTRWMWVLGPSSRPADLERHIRLDAGAIERAEAEGHRALVIDHEPPAGPPDVDIREVDSFETWCQLDEVQAIAFGESGDQRAAMVASRLERWEAHRTMGDIALLGLCDGVALAAGLMTELEHDVWFLLGGSTVPAARGRGLYRALIHARWMEAVARGGVALVIHAGPMSAPILLKLGFRDVGRVDLLLERDTEASV